jgi:carbamoyl-phosphate synthase small subunit
MGHPSGNADTSKTGSVGPAFLVLEDGSVVEGEAFGHKGTAYGELVFNTGMTGYQESLTTRSPSRTRRTTGRS